MSSNCHINHLKVVRYIAEMEREAQEAGIFIEERSDFGHLIELCKDLEDKPYPTAMLDPLKSDIGPHNGFWIKGTNANGEVVHVQAIRFDDLAGTNLARSFEDLSAFYYDTELCDPEERCRSEAPAARQITGRVCYHGEIWLKGGANGYRGRGLSMVLPRLALAIALLKWRPDYVYGLAYPATIFKGLILQYGYNHFQPRALYWERPHRDEPLDVWLSWTTRQDIMDMIVPPAAPRKVLPLYAANKGIESSSVKSASSASIGWPVASEARTNSL